MLQRFRDDKTINDYEYDMLKRFLIFGFALTYNLKSKYLWNRTTIPYELAKLMFDELDVSRELVSSVIEYLIEEKETIMGITNTDVNTFLDGYGFFVPSS